MLSSHAESVFFVFVFLLFVCVCACDKSRRGPKQEERESLDVEGGRHTEGNMNENEGQYAFSLLWRFQCLGVDVECPPWTRI